MTPEEKKLMTVVGLVAMAILAVTVIFVGKKREVAEFRKKQRGPAAQGRISSIRRAMKGEKEEGATAPQAAPQEAAQPAK